MLASQSFSTSWNDGSGTQYIDGSTNNGDFNLGTGDPSLSKAPFDSFDAWACGSVDMKVCATGPDQNQETQTTPVGPSPVHNVNDYKLYERFQSSFDAIIEDIFPVNSLPVDQYNAHTPSLPLDEPAISAQSGMHWAAGLSSDRNNFDPSSMLPFPGSSNNFNNIPGLQFGYQVFQRTPCTWGMCSESFARPTDLQRHVDSVHLGIKYHCTWFGCHNNRGKGYCRLEKLRTHQREKHGVALV